MMTMTNDVEKEALRIIIHDLTEQLKTSQDRIDELVTKNLELADALKEIHMLIGRGPGHGTVKDTLSCIISGILDLRNPIDPLL